MEKFELSYASQNFKLFSMFICLISFIGSTHILGACHKEGGAFLVTITLHHVIVYVNHNHMHHVISRNTF